MEVAILDGYSRYYFLYWDEAHFSAVDGVRPKLPALWADPVKLLPGNHWIEVTRHSTIGGYSVCVFEAGFHSQHRYALVAHSMRMAAPYLEQPYGEPYRGTILIEITPQEGPTRTLTVDASCAPRGSTPQFCRVDADCAEAPGYRCRPVLDGKFGICSSPER